jgi:hypothetical protein
MAASSVRGRVVRVPPLADVRALSPDDEASVVRVVVADASNGEVA